MNNITINYINNTKNNPVLTGYHWVESWLFSTNAKQIGMCAVWVPLLRYSLIRIPYISILYIFNYIYKYMPHLSVLYKPNKICKMKAWHKNGRIAKLSSEVLSMRGRIYGYVKKLEYVLLTTNEVVWYDSLHQMYLNAYNNDSDIISWWKEIWHFKEKLMILIYIICYILIDFSAQGPKDSRSLNKDIMEELQQVTASNNYFNYANNKDDYKRAGRDRSTSDNNNNLLSSGKGPSDKEKKSKEDKTVNKRMTPEMVRKFIITEFDKNKNKSIEGYYNGIIKIASNIEYLKMCYILIRKNSSLEDQKVIGNDFFENLSKSVLTGGYKFSLNKKYSIIKKDGSFREIIKYNIKDKIVHKSIQMLLESIYEPKFRECSHGFRPNRSVHSALNPIYLKGHHHTWVIKGDISKCFNNISHDLLLNILKKDIRCDKFLILIKKVISTGYKEDDKIIKSNLGIFQGAILSPILMNIVLHNFDVYVEDYIIPNYTKGLRRKTNPEYNKLMSLRYSRSHGVIKTKEGREAYLKARLLPRMLINDPNFRRSMYIRYADDFVYLFEGPKNELLEIKEQLKSSLNEICLLNLNEEKTIVSNISNGFDFLGSRIHKLSYKKAPIFKSHDKKGNIIFQRRAVRLRLDIPINYLIDKFIKNGIIRRNQNNRIFSIPNNSIILLDHYNIIRFYSMKWHGIKNFYSFAANRHKLGDFYWLLLSSLAKTLAKKHKMSSQAKAFQKYGKLLKDPQTNIMFPEKGPLKTIHDYKNKNINYNYLDKIIEANWFGVTTKNNFGQVCTICGTDKDIQMHHIRKVYNLRQDYINNKLKFNVLKGALNRKQIPLCQYHHMKLHNKELSIDDNNIITNYIKNIIK